MGGLCFKGIETGVDFCDPYGTEMRYDRSDISSFSKKKAIQRHKQQTDTGVGWLLLLLLLLAAVGKASLNVKL